MTDPERQLDDLKMKSRRQAIEGSVLTSVDIGRIISDRKKETVACFFANNIPIESRQAVKSERCRSAEKLPAKKFACLLNAKQSNQMPFHDQNKEY